MRIVVCAAVLVIFANAEISAKWSSLEESVAHHSALRTLGRKDVNYKIPNLMKRHERENTKYINLDQLANRTSQENIDNTKRSLEYLLRSKDRSIIDDIKSFHNLDFKPKNERLTYLGRRGRRPGKPPKTKPPETRPPKTKPPKDKSSKIKLPDISVNVEDLHIYIPGKDPPPPPPPQEIEVLQGVKQPPQYATHDYEEGRGPAQYTTHEYEEGRGPAQYTTHEYEEGKGPAQYATHDYGEGKGPAQYATHDYEEGKGPAQYATHEYEEGKGPAQYATHDYDKPKNGVKVDRIVILEVPSDKDFELLSRYNQQQKMNELNDRLEGFWKKEYHSKHLDNPLVRPHKKMKKLKWQKG